jgi:HK97 family phage major capsid protein
MDTKTLREELAALHTSAETLVSKAADEKRDFTDAEKADSDKQFARMTEIKSVLDRSAKLAEFSFSQKADNVELPSEPAGKAERDAIEIRVGTTFDRKSPVDRKAYNSALNRWMNTGDMDRRFATITGATASAILMPVDVAPPVTPMALNVFREALAAYGMEAWKTPSTRNINLPIYTAAAGGIVTATATSEVEQEPALTESIASVIKNYYSENLWFENRELAALDYDLLGATIPAMSYAKELALESDAITTVTTDSNVTGNSQGVATATVSGFTYGNFVSLNRTLPKRYQQNKVIILSKAAYSAAENLTTTTGFPILNQDAQNQSLKRFNGTPVVYSEYLSAFGANNVVGLIFSWQGARLRDAGEGDILQRFTQTANRQGQTGACLYGYHSFGYSPKAVALFTCPAS